MKLGIMQPYFLPYAGYFQLIAAVDQFIVYDNIKYTKRGWINRNRMLKDGTDALFSLPLRSASDYLQVSERELAADFDARKLLNQFAEAYRRAPFFAPTYELVEEIVRFGDRNLFQFIHNSIAKTCAYLGMRTPMLVSSRVPIDHSLKHQDRVLALCAAVRATTYVNAIGGTELYSKDEFRSRGVELKFIRSRPWEYRQFGDPFVAGLSIVDVMMFNARQQVADYLATAYELI